MTHRGGHVATARAAVAVVLLAPVLHFSALHLWHHRTHEGLPEALALAALQGVFDSAAAAVDEPGRAVVYAVVVTALWRFAFGRPARR